MAATVKMYYDWGGTDNTPGTAHNITDNGTNKIRFKTEDDATIDANNPIPIPATGDNNSFWKQVYMQCTDASGLTQIDNVRFYTDGASGLGTDVVLNVGDETPVKNSGADTGYDVAIGTTGVTGTIMTSHTDVTAVTSAFDYTSGSPLTVSISESSSIIDAANETTNYLVMQMRVGSTASSGAVSAETMTFIYDEI